MDTAFTLSFGDGMDAVFAASAARMCFDRIDSLEKTLTRFSDTSDVAVIRSLGVGETAVVSRETVDLLSVCAEVCAATAGAFNPTLSRRNFSDLEIDTVHCRVRAKGRVELDFGGIGKGFALDECRKILEGGQFPSAPWILDAGTSTIAVSGGPWRLGVGGRFKERSRVPAIVPLSDCSISGSGEEIRGEHIWNVREGTRKLRWEQSWAIAKSGAVADALTTAALSLSPAELDAAAAALDARILVARNQPEWMDRLRDPLVWHG